MEKITAIKIECPAYLGIDRETLQELTPISKINIFVGANNSGKSQFIRTIFSQTNYEVKIEKVDLDEKIANIQSSIENITTKFNEFKISSINNKDTNTITSLSKLPQYFHLFRDVFDAHRIKLSELTNFPRITALSSQVTPNNNQLELIARVIRQNAQSAIKYLNLIPASLGYEQFEKFYIPVLRGLRPISSDTSTNFYENQTLMDYFPDHKKNEYLDGNDPTKSLNIFTGMDFYNELTSFLLGNNTERKIISEYQNFLSTIIFEGKPVELIPNQKNKEL